MRLCEKLPQDFPHAFGLSASGLHLKNISGSFSQSFLTWIPAFATVMPPLPLSCITFSTIPRMLGRLQTLTLPLPETHSLGYQRHYGCSLNRSQGLSLTRGEDTGCIQDSLPPWVCYCFVCSRTIAWSFMSLGSVGGLRSKRFVSTICSDHI